VASGGYPGPYSVGREIRIPADLESEDLIAFHAGTEYSDGRLVTSGGRVLSVTAVRDDFAAAADASRDGASRIEFDGAYSRKDIGWRERARSGR
jgi:phosphoribosylamine-glycine ligase